MRVDLAQFDGAGDAVALDRRLGARSAGGAAAMADDDDERGRARDGEQSSR